MELELKHLAPYLPYKLKIYTPNSTWIGISSVLNYANKPTVEIYPILRPLSDLTKEIEVNGERFVPESLMSDMGHSVLFKNGKFRCDLDEDILAEFPVLGKPYNIEWLPYKMVDKLFEWHFDVFGLIEQGLAIDVNTLSK